MEKIMKWFFGTAEIPAKALYALMIAGFVLYASCIVASLVISN